MNVGVIDVESTIFQKGNPFSERNKLCSVGVRLSDGWARCYRIEHGEEPYGAILREIQDVVARLDVVVGFNIKFDLHWLKRYGVSLKPHQRVFDCQLAEFIITNQQVVMPSLANTVEKYGVGKKDSFIQENYWSKGIDTDAIPWEVIEQRNVSDLEITWRLYEHMVQKLLPDAKKALVSLQNQDLLVLQEMEWNGVRFDWSYLREQSQKTRANMEKIDEALAQYTGGFKHFNPASTDHVSALLYGGRIEVDIAEPYEHTFKAGKQAGATATRHRWHTESVDLPRLVEPLKGSELAKPGYWSTDEKILRQLAKPKKLIRLLLERADAEKLLGTYYEGLQNLKKDMEWNDGLLHGNLNQSVVITGRLSSSKPNQQNMDGRLKKAIVSRFQTGL